MSVINDALVNKISKNSALIDLVCVCVCCGRQKMKVKYNKYHSVLANDNHVDKY